MVDMNLEIKPEIEATFVNIDKDALRKRLRELGGELLQEETLMKRTVFATGEQSFARVRDEGNCITMSYKRQDSATLSGMKEICLKVNNYDDAVDFMKALTVKVKSEQETLREEWLLDGVEIDIDTWPWLPTFVELEGPSEKSVEEVTEKLDFVMDEAIFGSVDDIYKIYYDVTNHEVNQEWREIKFGDGSVPEWLEKRRRK